MKYTAFRLTLSLMLLTVLSACGFHLRGQNVRLDALPQPLYIVGVRPNSTLNRELRQQLRLSGVSLTSQAGEAAAILRISKINHSKRLLSLDSRNKAAEYELQESLHFSLGTTNGSQRLPEQTIRVIRNLLSPQDQILARQHEEEALRGDMRRELVKRLIQRLAAHF